MSDGPIDLTGNPIDVLERIFRSQGLGDRLDLPRLRAARAWFDQEVPAQTLVFPEGHPDLDKLVWNLPIDIAPEVFGLPGDGPKRWRVLDATKLEDSEPLTWRVRFIPCQDDVFAWNEP